MGYVCVCVTVSLSGMVWTSWVDSATVVDRIKLEDVFQALLDTGLVSKEVEFHATVFTVCI